MTDRTDTAQKLPCRPLRRKEFGRLFESLEMRRLLTATYTFTDLTPNLAGNSTANAISNNGNIALTSNGDAAVIINGTFKDLGPGFTEDINDAGQAVGDSYNAATQANAPFYYSGGSKTVPVVPQGSGLTGLSLVAINASGDAVGQAMGGSGSTHAVLYHSGQVTDLGTFQGGLTTATGINDSGEIIGHTFFSGSSAIHSWLYKNGAYQDLGLLPSGDTNEVAHAINNGGLIVSTANTAATKAAHQFPDIVSSADGAALQNLTTSSADQSNLVYDVNASGTYVGFGLGTTSQGYVGQGTTQTLLNNLITNSPGATVVSAYSINDSGHIVGLGKTSGGENNHAILLTPAVAQPTPATISGTVYQDYNSNGRRDNGEVALSKIAVTLTSGNVTSTTRTDANGAYVFANVDPSRDPYTLTVILPRSTGPSASVSPTSGQTLSGQDFGIAYDPTLSDVIYGTVYNDANGNGKQDDSEAGVGNVTVTEQFTDIYGSGIGNKTFTTTTDATGLYPGLYYFTKLPAGQNAVSQTLPAGYKETTANSGKTFITDSSNVPVLIDFGQQKSAAPTTGTISGLAFKDANGNGKQDAGETGLGGVNVFAGSDGFATTAADGSYSMTLAPGSYYVYAGTPSGYSVTTDPEANLTVTAGKNTVFNIGDTPSSAGPGKSTISGTIYNDANNDGTQDNGETGIKGVTVTLSLKAQAQIVKANAAPAPMTMTSDANGKYTFTGLAGGEYIVADTVPAADTQTAPASGSYDLTLGLGGSQTVSGRDFGLKAKPVAATHSISGTVYNDTNDDSKLSAGESGFAGITVTVTPTSAGATPAKTFTTTASGAYSFNGLADGTYTVSAPVPTGYTKTSPSEGNAFFLSFTSGNGDTTGANFGFYKAPAQTVSITGQAFNDVNGNGLRDQGETEVLPGVTIKLTGLASATTTTGNGGTFTFSNLAPGNYTLTQTALSGYTTTTQPVTLDAPHYDFLPLFGQQKTPVVPPADTASISGTVFNDANDDGKRAASGEAGLAGVTVTLSQQPQVIGNIKAAAAPAPVTMLTDGSGNYSFKNLPAGDYVVTATSPTGYTQTTPTGQGVGEYDVALAAGQMVGGELFGEYKKPVTPPPVTGSISGVVFNDLDGDGKREAGEGVLAGVTITLDPENAQPNLVKAAAVPGEMTFKTGADGTYSFSGLAAGEYFVFETPLDGYTQTTPSLAGKGGFDVTLTTGQNVSGEQFGQHKPAVVPPPPGTGTITGTLFNDSDGDGLQDNGDGVTGVRTVFLDTNGNGTLDAGEPSTESDAAGKYTFANVATGSVKVSRVFPAGFKLSNPSAGTNGHDVIVTVTDGGTATANLGTFGNDGTPLPPPPKFGTIAGTLWNDSDGNGMFDTNEEVGTGVRTVFLDTNRNGKLDAGEVSTKSSSKGKYSFSNVPVGTVAVSRIYPAGFHMINPSAGTGGHDVLTDVLGDQTATVNLGTHENA